MSVEVVIKVTVMLSERYLPVKGEVYYTPNLMLVTGNPVRMVWDNSLDDLHLLNLCRVHRGPVEAFAQQVCLNNLMYSLIC